MHAIWWTPIMQIYSTINMHSQHTCIMVPKELLQDTLWIYMKNNRHMLWVQCIVWVQKAEYMVSLILIHWNADETKKDILWYKSEYRVNIYHKFSQHLSALW